MVAAAATSSFFPVPSSPDTSAKSPKNGASSTNLGGIKSKSLSSGRLKVKANAQAPPKLNGTPLMEGVKHEKDPPSRRPTPRTFINLLPDWSMLLAAITTVFLAAEKQWMMLDGKPRRPDMLADPFGLGWIVQDGLVFQQNFSIRSYEIGADRTMSMETLVNHLQESALNHVKTLGLMGDGFGSTPEMCKRNLIWVVSRMQLVVDRYPTWGDAVQIDTWASASGKNGLRRDWLLRDSNTGEVLTRASSICVMMNKQTRKLSKIPEEVRGEINRYFLDTAPILEEDSGKLGKIDDNIADNVQTGLKPRWSDLDVNQHVNHAKYIGWILESAPVPILEGHELSGMTLEYRRECGKDNVLRSLTAVVDAGVGSLAKSSPEVECQHLLQLENGNEIARGRTEWRPKRAKNHGNLCESTAENA